MTMQTERVLMTKVTWSSTSAEKMPRSADSSSTATSCAASSLRTWTSTLTGSSLPDVVAARFGDVSRESCCAFGSTLNAQRP